MNKAALASLVLLTAVTGTAQSADAATTTATMAVSSLTVAACIVVATPMLFGTLNLIGSSPNDATATITATCTPGTAYTIGLDNGVNFSTTRRMKSLTAATYVPYGLFSDTARATPWGTTAGQTVSGTAPVGPALLTVYGRVPGGTTAVAADTYLDTVTVTLTY